MPQAYLNLSHLGPYMQIPEAFKFLPLIPVNLDPGHIPRAIAVK
jgi:hypothetical protein